MYSGKSEAAVIGPVDEKWDEVLLVEYPSIAAFQEMGFSDEYRSVTYHRTAALEDSRLIPIIGRRIEYRSFATQRPRSKPPSNHAFAL